MNGFTIPTFSDTRAGARELIEYFFEESVAARLLELIDTNDAYLEPDPQVLGVWGILDCAGSPVAALFLNEADASVDEEWLHTI